MSARDALLDSLPRTTLVVGKGGVGKTTCAAGISAGFAQSGDRTLLVSTDPAAALAEVLGATVGAEAAPVRGSGKLDARQLDAAQLRREFLDRWRETIAQIVDAGTYLDREDVDGLVDAALPGADEIFALLALGELIAGGGEQYARIVVDTAPTGHTLRLLALPDTFRALLDMLELMQDKHRFMVRALTHRYRRGAADDFLDMMRARVDSLRAALGDGALAAAVVVTRAEPVVLAETRRYVADLDALHLRVAALVVNTAKEREIGDPVGDQIPRYVLPRASTPPQGLESIEKLMRRMSRAGTLTGSPAQAHAKPSRAARPDAALDELVRTLTIVAGKGGVGKSTVACALAIAAVEATGESLLLVSTDPAPSLADALGASTEAWAGADGEHTLDDVPGLVVRQMDAGAAFARLRDEYRSRVNELFDGLVGRGSGMDVERDRAIVRDLLALAPPGIDELYALSLLGDAIAAGRYARIVVDPAPTGHLLRLLEMPAIALDWSHRLMRLMLKYREVVSLGDAAESLLAFAKRTRALDALLHDPGRGAAVVVALDEPVVRAETERLVSAIAARGVSVDAVIWNRLSPGSAPLPATRPRRQFFADEISPPPIGARAIRDWARRWRERSSVS